MGQQQVRSVKQALPEQCRPEKEELVLSVLTVLAVLGLSVLVVVFGCFLEENSAEVYRLWGLQDRQE